MAQASHRQIILLVLLSLLLAAALLLWQPAQQPPASPSGGDFTLQSAAGPVSLHNLNGKVVLIYFGYTSCPDICPTSLTMIKIALAQLSKDELAQLQVLFISVDPTRDTPQRLAEYSQHFHPQITGITGSEEEVAKVAAQYGAVYQRAEGDTALGYTVDHSSVIYVVNRQGRLVSNLPHGTAPKQIAQAIRQQLANR